MNAESLHLDSPPRDGWYYVWSEPTDKDHPYKTRHKIPVRIWTVETRDEVGEKIDVDRQYVKIGDELVSVTQEQWLYIAKRPITEDDYEALYITGEWK